MCFYLPTQSSVSVLLRQAKIMCFFYMSYFPYKRKPLHSDESYISRIQKDFWAIKREEVHQWGWSSRESRYDREPTTSFFFFLSFFLMFVVNAGKPTENRWVNPFPLPQDKFAFLFFFLVKRSFCCCKWTIFDFIRNWVTVELNVDIRVMNT